MSERPYISCRELIEFIADYLEGALTAVQTEDFQRHLAICISCRSYLLTYQTTMRASREVMCHEELAREAPEDLIRAILEAGRRS